MPSEPLSSDVVMAVIAQIVEIGSIVSTQHIKVRMRQRNFTMQDVLNVLEQGRAKMPPAWNAEHENWVYTIEGADLEGEALSVCVVIEYTEEMLILVTGF